MKILPASEPSNIVQSIKDLPLKDFIKCYADKDLSVLGNGTPDELNATWLRLLSEYYSVKGDEHTQHYISVVAEKTALEYRQCYISFLIESLQVCYVQSVCDILTELFPQLTFTEETYLESLVLVGNIEKRHKIRLNELAKDFEALEKGKGKGGAQTPDQIYESFLQTLLDINQVEKASYSEDNLSTYKYALLCKRLDKHIENLKKPK